MTQNLTISLDDKYTAKTGRIMLNGVQALVRVPIMQHLRDKSAGLNTAGYVSGYRGSPIGGYDSALWQAQKHLQAHQIKFQSGVNEDLAATAVWGTQQLDNYDAPLYDGVFAIWYGKGPGVDRSLDPIKHGNYSGTHPNGGVLAVFGDDHPGKSSTVAHQSEQAMMACSVPVLYPATVDEIISYGLHGFAMSRYAGCWVSMKTVNETIERTETIDIPDPDFVIPDADPGAVHYRKNHFSPQEDDMTTRRQRLPAAMAFARANPLDRVISHGDTKRLAIVTAGKAYLDVRKALDLLGLSLADAAQLGIGVYKVGMIWPLETQGLLDFAADYDEVFVIEEKREFLEDQIARALYPLAKRPRLSGKKSPEGSDLLPGDIQLEAGYVAGAILERLRDNGIDTSRFDAINTALHAPAPASASALRLPYFCSGCPHNTSTRVPDGSIAGAGIGCHGMTMVYRDDTRTATQMGGEGVNWVGAATFTSTPHIFQNLGDGTYFHSGLLAIRAAVASKVNITYKILYNDTVALTGGQPLDGTLSVADLTHQIQAEGVRKIMLVSDHPEKYDSGSKLAAGVTIHHRDDLDALQRQIREVPGVSALIYEQTCAAEKRRRRKRGTFPDPLKRAFINPEVCEGCGDCSVQSTCMSIFPLQTQLGKKRQIDQSSCNKDYSCVKGFCPSFVTVHGAELKKGNRLALPEALQIDLPAAGTAPVDTGFACMIAGIGGTGVVTIGAVLSMAAMIEGLHATCYDMTGLSQKGGAVFSHLRIGSSADHLLAAKIGQADADLMLAFDAMAGLAADPLKTVANGKTRIVANAQVVPNAILAIDSLAPLQLDATTTELANAAGDDNTYFVDASRIAVRLLGDSIGGNMFLLGYAMQSGLLPVSVEALQQAIRLNGVSVDFNLTALHLGRLYAVDAPLVHEHMNPAAVITQESLDDRIRFQMQRLSDFQNTHWANDFAAAIKQARAADEAVANDRDDFTRTVVDALAKLMTYKDEYEVARLHTQTNFARSVRDQFDGDVTIRYHLAPPLLSKRDPVTGHLRKREFGPWIYPAFSVLAKLKFLRNTPLDIFGYTAERRMERQLIEDYKALVNTLSSKLTKDNYDKLVDTASLAMTIRGFGHVKERNVEAYRGKVDDALAGIA
tara:strand:+ start:173081 stop:176488 length:3408 start_codon:yes stop_codon:yes gene_type:complete